MTVANLSASRYHFSFSQFTWVVSGGRARAKYANILFLCRILVMDGKIRFSRTRNAPNDKMEVLCLRGGNIVIAYFNCNYNRKYSVPIIKNLSAIQIGDWMCLTIEFFDCNYNRK